MNPTTAPAPSAAHRKIAFLVPAGEVVNHDRVISYESRDKTRIIDARLNIGDTFVFESSLRLVRFEELRCFSTYSGNVDDAVSQMNECDVAILRGSNYINPHMDWGNLPEILERSRIPVVAFGVGAQAPRYEPVTVNKKSARFLATIAERSHSIGCRGKFTASVLYDLGIKNVTAIGCPSLFRSNDPNIRIAWPPPDVKKVGFATTRGFSPGYCDNTSLATSCQLAILEGLIDRHQVFVLSQGEVAEKIFYYRAYDRMESARQSMADTGWDLEKLPWLENLYWKGMFFGTSPLDYEKMVKQCDLVMGFRLHGNLMALSLGIPAIYVTYDSRTREIVDQFSIPHHDILSEKAFSLEESMDEGIFDGFNDNFAQNYAVIRDFLANNGISHRMLG